MGIRPAAKMLTLPHPFFLGAPPRRGVVPPLRGGIKGPPSLEGGLRPLTPRIRFTLDSG